MNLTMLQFSRPAVLLLLWGLPVLAGLWFLAHGRAQRRLNRFVAADLRARLHIPGHAGRRLVRGIGALIGLGLLLIAAAGPYRSQVTGLVRRPGHDVVLALDVSRSMLVADVSPNRLSSARAALRQILNTQSRDRFAVVAFRQGGRLLCPLTFDHAFARQALDGAFPDSAPPGETDLASGLNTALSLFQPGRTRRRILVVASDGEDLAGRPGALTGTMATNGVTVIGLGAGTPQGGVVPGYGPHQPALRHDGRVVTSRLQAAPLRALAVASGGLYLALRDEAWPHAGIGGLYEAFMRDLARGDAPPDLSALDAPLYRWFAIPAFLLLLPAFGLWSRRPNGTCAKYSAKIGSMVPTAIRMSNVQQGMSNIQGWDTKGAVLLIAGCCLAAPAVLTAGPSASGEARRASRLFNRQQYEASANGFASAAAAGQGPTRARHRFSAAAAWYANGSYDKAENALRESAGVTGWQVAHLMAEGTIAFSRARRVTGDDLQGWKMREQLLASAAEAFLTAVRQAPSPQGPASQNLGLALAELDTARQAVTAREAANPPEPQVPETQPEPQEPSPRPDPDRDTASTGETANGETTESQSPAGSLSDADIEALLLDALARERDDAQQRRQRNRRLPFKADARDW